MRRIGISVVMVAVALTAGAATARSGSASKLWVEGYGCWNTYSMTDVNRQISEVNRDLSDASRSIRLDKIRNGSGLGIRAGTDLSRVVLGVGYERYFAASEAGDARGTPQLKVPANAFYGLAEVKPPGSRLAGVRLGMAVGVVVLAPVSRVVEASPYAPPQELTGTGPLFEIYATGEWWATPQLALIGSAGYRVAKVDKPEIREMLVSDLAVDYGGLQVHAGLKAALFK